MSDYVFFSFVLATVLVAFLTYFIVSRMEKSNSVTEEYFTGGRALSWPVIGGSLLLTNLSTEQLVGLNGAVFGDKALVGIAWETLAAFAMIATALLFLPRYLASGFTTTPAFLEKRFDKTTRAMVSGLFLFGYVTVLLPVVLYTGSLAMIGMFDISQPLWIIATAIGILGSSYAIFGGLKSVAVSDTINGIGLLIGGLVIPILALISLGKGSFFSGLAMLGDSNPEYLAVLTQKNIENKIVSVPWPTLLTGMMFVQVFYWSTNQVIVQRAMAAKSLKDGQKGVLFASALKLIGPVMLCLPAIVALHMLGNTHDSLKFSLNSKEFRKAAKIFDNKTNNGQLKYDPKKEFDNNYTKEKFQQEILNIQNAIDRGNDLFSDPSGINKRVNIFYEDVRLFENLGINFNDKVYPAVVRHVLPSWSLGLFAAVILGSILSSFNSALNSASTLFSLQFYHGYFNKNATGKQIVSAGKKFGIGLAIASICIVPFLEQMESIFDYLQKVNGLYSVPIIAIFILGILTKHIPAFGAKVGMTVGFLSYAYFTFFPIENFHWLHCYFISFTWSILAMLFIGYLKPKSIKEIEDSEKLGNPPVDLTPWKHASTVSYCIIITAVGIYFLLSLAAG
tara:strand:+ start:683 stop:2542 length:1860 start_codon:yes stop_codon:yes gene_type:complete